MSVEKIVRSMTIEEKIGQKIMLDFRYWNRQGQTDNAMTTPNRDVASIVSDNAIGGVILFSENLKDREQIWKLTAWYASLSSAQGARLFIATDNEGGNVFRLPRGEYPSFPGNMALGAAIQGGASDILAFEQGKRMARDMADLNINTNFAPVVDVNTNPYNPVINVRSFSDDVDLVMDLAEQMTAGMRSGRLITTYKHYPGHGAASVDSHSALPMVNRSRDEAFDIDLAPYRQAIERGLAPDMIMTAHIRYPSLDGSLVTDRKGNRIVVPATMSREIQSHILRDQLGFQGVSISDALDMGAIADHFDPDTAIELVFRAGVDIALMPVNVHRKSDTYRVPQLIKKLAGMVRSGELSEDEITASVERILQLKVAYALVGPKRTVAASAVPPVNVEKQIADRSIVLLKNDGGKLPVRDVKRKFFILTSLLEQGEGIAVTLRENGYDNVVVAAMDEMNIGESILRCDVFLIGLATPTLDRNHPQLLRAESLIRLVTGMKKTVIFVSLRSSYDLGYIPDCGLDCALATYSYLGYEKGVWRGPSMRSLAEVLIGKLVPAGKLPVDTWRCYDTNANSGVVEQPYERGFGLSAQRI